MASREECGAAVPFLACVGLCVAVVRGGVPPDTWKIRALELFGYHGILTVRARLGVRLGQMLDALCRARKERG